jgi:hypothetical protein
VFVHLIVAHGHDTLDIGPTTGLVCTTSRVR